MDKDRIIYVDGPFERGMARAVCNGMETMAKQSQDDILLVVNSFGGDCCAAFSIYDTIQMLQGHCDVAGLAVSKVMSAGALTVSSCTKGKRYSLPSTRFMYHGPNGAAVLSQEGLETMRYFKEEQERIYAELSGRSRAYFDELMNRDFYATPQEAISHGLLDGIVGSIYEIDK